MLPKIISDYLSKLMSKYKPCLNICIMYSLEVDYILYICQCECACTIKEQYIECSRASNDKRRIQRAAPRRCSPRGAGRPLLAESCRRALCPSWKSVARRIRRTRGPRRSTRWAQTSTRASRDSAARGDSHSPDSRYAQSTSSRIPSAQQDLWLERNRLKHS